MSNGLVPPLQLYPTEDGNLEMEVQENQVTNSIGHVSPSVDNKLNI
jgi:hypothetical protein